MPYAIEKDSILNATGEERNIPYLINAAKILEKGGADFLVMPCNTLHAFDDKATLENIIASFEDKGIQNIILACTDLQLLNPGHHKLKIHDTMKILADATVQENLISKWCVFGIIRSMIVLKLS